MENKEKLFKGLKISGFVMIVFALIAFVQFKLSNGGGDN